MKVDEGGGGGAALAKAMLMVMEGDVATNFRNGLVAPGFLQQAREVGWAE